MPKQAKEPNGNYMFLIPNDKEGEYFLHLCRKYAVNGVHFKQRGLQADRQKLVRQGKASKFTVGASVKLEDSDRIRLYATVGVKRGNTEEQTVFGPKDAQREWDSRMEGYETARELRNLKAKVKLLVADVG